jgi:DNA adenine methylase Dam
MNYINTPFNYTGSKYKLLGQILPHLDYDKKVFVDVFTGGGSVYTNVLDKYDLVFINDIISDLIRIHKALNINPDAIINETKKLATCDEDKEKFLNLRNSYNNNPTPEKLWALMLSCTSNLMRFNKSFKFNQTWGKRGWNKNTDKKTSGYIEHIQNYKNKIRYLSKNFYEIPIKKDTMVYLDPPYINTEAGYNAYWSKDLEQKLYDYVLSIDKIGSSFMVSGVIKHDSKDSELLIKLSEKFKLINLDFNYNKVSRKGKKKTQEVVIINY